MWFHTRDETWYLQGSWKNGKANVHIVANAWIFTNQLFKSLTLLTHNAFPAQVKHKCINNWFTSPPLYCCSPLNCGWCRFKGKWHGIVRSCQISEFKLCQHLEGRPQKQTAEEGNTPLLLTFLEGLLLGLSSGWCHFDYCWSLALNISFPLWTNQ